LVDAHHHHEPNDNYSCEYSEHDRPG
jgi:hypothetical protein